MCWLCSPLQSSWPVWTSTSYATCWRTLASDQQSHRWARGSCGPLLGVPSVVLSSTHVCHSQLSLTRLSRCWCAIHTTAMTWLLHSWLCVLSVSFAACVVSIAFTLLPACSTGPQGAHHRHLAAAQLRPAPLPADSSSTSGRLCGARGPESGVKEALPAQGACMPWQCVCYSVGAGGSTECDRSRSHCAAAAEPAFFETSRLSTFDSTCAYPGGMSSPVCVLQANGAIVEVAPLCVLDFYVHESYQRQGVGKALFEVRAKCLPCSAWLQTQHHYRIDRLMLVRWQPSAAHTMLSYLWLTNLTCAVCWCCAVHVGG